MSMIAPNTSALRQRQQPIRDRAHLDSLRDIPCVICGGPAEPAHFRAGLGGGMELKSGDDLALPLAPHLHREQHRVGELRFWRDHLLTNDQLLIDVMRAFARSFYADKR